MHIGFASVRAVLNAGAEVGRFIPFSGDQRNVITNGLVKYKGVG